MGDIKLTDKDKSILDIIKNNKIGLSPTEIGMKLGKSYNSASSYCSSSLRKLKEAGEIIKIKIGPKTIYKLKVITNGKN